MGNIINYANNRQNAQNATSSASEVGVSVLNYVQEKLRFAGDELQRMENESGIPLSEEQTATVDAYFKTSQRIRKILFITGKYCRQWDIPNHYLKCARGE